MTDLDRIGGLSSPSKMPGYGWSTPAEDCLVGSKLRPLPGATCFDCYALKGHYVVGNVKPALVRRLAHLRLALKTPKGQSEWVSSFARVLKEKQRRAQTRDCDYFRWHDSGDLQSLEYLRMIVRVARKTPSIRHWLPTREYKIVRDYLKEVPSGFPSNLTVRLSAHWIGQPVPMKDERVQYSTVHKKGDQPPEGYTACPAPTTDGECRDCRECWFRDRSVSYVKH